MRVVVCGVSGAGKSVVGRGLAERLGYPFLDADEFHSAANKAKMSAGIPLDDSDRWPWLEALNGALRDHPDVVMACSALKQVYRDRLAAGIPDVRWVALVGSREVLHPRMAARVGHFMPQSLLDSQLAAWEPPQEGITVDVARRLEDIVEQVVQALR
ncbi:MAG: gluconokinase [Armatimonadetes bacterium]|nr:gluconokinase [Armatimonadota bacterium]